MKAAKKALFVTIAALTLSLTACGGGGDSTPAPGASVTAFALQAGFKARVQSGATDNFSISGTCGGTSTLTTSAASASSFEGVGGFGITQTQTLSFTGCTPASTAVTGSAYFDSAYSPLGTSIPGVEYTKFVSAPAPLPATVRVGDTAVFATVTVYTDSGKATMTGQRQLSYVVAADSSTTALVTFITRSSNNAGQLLFVAQSTYRMAGDGTLTIVSIDVQYSTTSTTHLLLTKV